MATESPAHSAPYREVAFGPYEAECRPLPGGGWQLRAPQTLAPYPRAFTAHLERWAAERPGHTFLAQRSAEAGRPWLRLGYAQTLARVQALSQALLDLGLSAERPLMILSGNSLEHALLTLAALHVGVPVAPISPAYALLDPSAARVVHAATRLTPGLVYAGDAGRFAAAIGLAVPADVPVLLGRTGQALPSPLPAALQGRHTLAFDTLQATPPTPAVAAAHAAVDGDTVAKFLFTSGSTQAPKAVVNTHRMLCSNQQMYAQCYPFLEQVPPVLVDWLPWHHTAGGNSNLGLVLRNGGTLYIDEGKPTPEGMAETVANLREISPTAIYTVPKGLEMLTQQLAQDAALRETVFRELRLVFAAGAAMPQAVIEAFDTLAVQTLGCRVPMTMGLGMTETAPFAVSHHRPGWQAGVIGLPAPGLDLKLVPVGDKLEVRYRGPSITPGYWRQPELQAETFDEEGYLCSGDAAVFISAAEPGQGLRFDGRIAEDFKLISGTWVSVSAVRAHAMSAALPVVHDVVLAGDGRDSLGLLVFLAPGAAQLAPELGPGAPLAALAGHPAVRAWAQRWLDQLAAAGTGSSNRVTRLLLLDDAPLAAAGEVTDKGSLNQRAVLKRRAAAVEALYAESPPDPRVLRAAR